MHINMYKLLRLCCYVYAITFTLFLLRSYVYAVTQITSFLSLFSYLSVETAVVFSN
jgi:hypothetical protein